MIRVLSDDVRIRGAIERSREVGLNHKKILKTIASFENVEKFQAWKNKQTGILAYVIKRIGPNNYRKLRNLLNEG